MPQSLTENLDLRYGHMRRAQQSPPKLRQNLRQLGARGGYVPAPAKGSQSVKVKSGRAVTSTTRHHLRYLERGKGPDGQDATLFTAPDQVVDKARLVQAVQQDPHRWDIILSPDASRQLNMPQFVQRWMQQLEQDTGRRYDWVAAVHHDTGHLHAHVLIRGRDTQGQEVYFDTAYLRQGMRYRAEQIATRQLGPAVVQQELVPRRRVRSLHPQYGLARGPQQGIAR